MTIGDMGVMPGVKHFTSDPENFQFAIIFDDTVIGLDALGRTLDLVGCPIQSIRALTFR